MVKSVKRRGKQIKRGKRWKVYYASFQASVMHNVKFENVLLFIPIKHVLRKTMYQIMKQVYDIISIYLFKVYAFNDEWKAKIIVNYSHHYRHISLIRNLLFKCIYRVQLSLWLNYSELENALGLIFLPKCCSATLCQPFPKL